MIFYIEKNSFHRRNSREETRQERDEETKRKTETNFMIHDLKIKCIRNRNNVFYLGSGAGFDVKSGSDRIIHRGNEYYMSITNTQVTN